MVGENPICIFNYLDYRVYLSDFYSGLAKKNSRFSYRALAKKAGFKSPSMFKMVLDRARNLNEEHIEGLSLTCKLHNDERDYFATLVRFNQCENESLKSTYKTRLLQLAMKQQTRYVDPAQTELLSRWYFIALLEIIRVEDFQFNPQWIQNRFGGILSSDDIASTLALLEAAGFVERQGDTLRLTSKIVSAGWTVPAETIQNYHKQTIRIGIEALSNVPAEQREYSSASIAIAQSDLPKLKARIREFANEIVQTTSAVEKVNEVYQFNIQFFPLTKSGASK